MELDKAKVRKHFDRHAHEYDRYACVQQHMAEKLLELIDNELEGRWSYQRDNAQVNDGGASLSQGLYPETILEIGCGTGFITTELRRRFPRAQLTVIDLSEAMIAQARLKLGSHVSGVTFIVGDAESVRLSEQFDLIVSGATFQWFNEPERTVKKYVKSLRPGGMLAFSTFAPGTFYELHESFRMAESQLGLPPVRHGLDYPDEADWRSWFSAWRALFHWEEETLVEIYPTVKDFLLSVKRIGAGNAGKDSGIGFQSRKLFAEMETRYASMFGCKNGIRATYQAGYGIFRSIMAK